jgi:hypothetical protein
VTVRHADHYGGRVQAILATLGYVLSPDGRRVLMLHREA